MKKILLVFMLLGVIVFSACGDISSDVTLSSDFEMETIENNTDETIEVETVEVETHTPTEATIEETVLLDDAGIKITAKEFENSWMGTELKLLVENNTDKNLCVQARNCSVNGYMAETFMSVDVAASKKANDSLTFSNLEELGITAIADIELSFHVFDNDTWNTYLDTEMVRITTSLADSFVYEYDDSGETIFDESGIKIVSKGIVKDYLLGQSIALYIFNGSDKPITVQTRDVSLNGFMVDAICSEEVMPGKHALTDITFLSSDLEENGISAITNAELSFHIFNSETWSTIKDTSTISLSF